MQNQYESKVLGKAVVYGFGEVEHTRTADGMDVWTRVDGIKFLFQKESMESAGWLLEYRKVEEQ